MRDIIITTVGTSLLGNLRRSEDGDWQKLLDQGNAKGLAVRMAALDPTDKILGAEVNSLASLVQRDGGRPPARLKLLVSDTGDGRLTGSILRHYFAGPPWRLPEVETAVLDGLTDQDVNQFQNAGLRNLVRVIVEEVRRHGASRLIINATGGYKAQISFAGLIGQALHIPVCYLFERFSRIIELPPQPVALDLGLWLEKTEVFYALAEGVEGRFPEAEDDERLRGLVETMEEENDRLVFLSAMGQLFHETFRLRFAETGAAMLPPDCGQEPNEKTVKYEDQNHGKHTGLRVFLERLLERGYIKRIYTHYYHPSLTRANLFRKSATGQMCQIEGWFSGAGGLTKFDLVTTAETSEQQQACLADLNEAFCG